MENEKMIPVSFESSSIPFSGDSLVTKKWLSGLSASQRQLAEEFFFELGSSAEPMLQAMTPEKIGLLMEVFQERQKARLAIARWNWVAKSIKYSFFSLSLSMATGYLVGWQLEGSVYDLYDILAGYLGEEWTKRWFLALFAGSVHNVYDSIMLQRAVKKIREFTQKWVAKKLFPKTPKPSKNKPDSA
jgi:hypothetical protein